MYFSKGFKNTVVLITKFNIHLLFEVVLYMDGNSSMENFLPTCIILGLLLIYAWHNFISFYKGVNRKEKYRPVCFISPYAPFT